MQAPQQEADLSPDILFETLFSLAPSRALSAGVQLHVFSYIAAGKQNRSGDRSGCRDIGARDAHAARCWWPSSC